MNNEKQVAPSGPNSPDLEVSQYEPLRGMPYCWRVSDAEIKAVGEWRNRGERAE